METSYPPLSGRYNKILNELRLIAEDIEPVRNARIAAAIIKQGKIVGVGTCSRKTSTFQRRYGKNDHADFFHAEVAAIKAARFRLRTSDLSDCTIMVVRRKFTDMHRSNVIDALVAPCSGCMGAIKHHGIKTLIYTLDDGLTVIKL